MFLKALEGKKIILASKSPRRQQLLGGLEIVFEVRTKDVDENYPADLKREAIPRYLSELKAAAFRNELLPDEWLITSDTTVHLDGEVLEKPQDRNHAIAMLKKMSGKKHTVITAVTISSIEKQRTFHDETTVCFAPLEEDEITHYIDHYKPFDKAGSYGVQEFIGYMGIERIEGSFYNVMGLPLQKLYQELKKF